ncbi:MAG: hypothetical protein Q8S84_08705 [bacterium]|nr:hypothetical protein [bacterium]MDP3381508.1 hypothetical protein [bacterium]
MCVFAQTFIFANFISTLTSEDESNHKSEEYKEKNPFSIYLNSHNLSSLNFQIHSITRDAFHSFTIIFSHLYSDISHSIFFLVSH